jgi:hypothetical protein
MRRLLVLAVAGLSLAACSSSGAARSTSDSRVRSFLGRIPPDLAPDARALNATPTTLAALRGRVVYVQFAFPT